MGKRTSSFRWTTWAGGFPGGSVGKSPPDNAGDAGDTGFILGLGRCPRGEDGNPLQYSCLENSMDRGAWWATVHEVTKESDMTKWLHRHTRMWVGQNPKEDGEKSANLHAMER